MSGKPAPAQKVGGVRTKKASRPAKRASESDDATPQTTVTAALEPQAEAKMSSDVIATDQAFEVPSKDAQDSSSKAVPSTYHPPQPHLQKHVNKHHANKITQQNQPRKHN